MSRLTFLGTGAADWSRNDIVRSDYRGFSSILLDDSVLIDIGGCFDYTERTHQPDLLKKVDTVLITHSHDDHYRGDFLARLCGESKHTVTVYGDSSLQNRLPSCDNLRFEPLDARFYPSFSVGKFTVTALRANHATPDRSEQPLHYYADNGQTRVFFGFDGGWLTADTWEFLQRHPIDLYLMDATGGDQPFDFRNFSHNNARMRDYLRDTCRANGVLHDRSEIILTHIARTLNPEHTVLSKQNEQKGYRTAYDGMTYDFV